MLLFSTIFNYMRQTAIESLRTNRNDSIREIVYANCAYLISTLTALLPSTLMTMLPAAGLVTSTPWRL